MDPTNESGPVWGYPGPASTESNSWSSEVARVAQDGSLHHHHPHRHLPLPPYYNPVLTLRVVHSSSETHSHYEIKDIADALSLFQKATLSPLDTGGFCTKFPMLGFFLAFLISVS